MNNGAPGRPPSRQNKRMVSVYVEPEALKQLRIIALDEDTSVQALMVEALDDLFVKRGIADDLGLGLLWMRIADLEKRIAALEEEPNE